MRVTLVNKEEVKDLFRSWGEYARVCYDSAKGREEIIGKHCFKTGHYSGSRTTYFKFHIEGVSRALTAQLNRHSVGVVINEKSMRYVDFSNANIKVPKTIENNEQAKEIFNNAVDTCLNTYKEIQEILGNSKLTHEEINQDCRYILPIGCETEGMWGFSLEAIEHFMNKRLCNRSQWEIRELANLMKKEILEVLPELKENLVPECEKLMYCNEGKSCCGRKMTKEDFKEAIKN